MSETRAVDRRDFLKATGLATAGLCANPGVVVAEDGTAVPVIEKHGQAGVL